MVLEQEAVAFTFHYHTSYRCTQTLPLDDSPRAKPSCTKDKSLPPRGRVQTAALSPPSLATFCRLSPQAT
jgi:hypothetical protein